MKLTATILSRRAPRPFARAFTLLEVMIAIGVFFVAIFAILELTSRTLKNARSLNRQLIDPASLAAELSLTNALEEGMESGDLGPDHPEVKWTRQVTEVSSNGLFQVDFLISEPSRGQPVESTLTVLLFRPAGAQAVNAAGQRTGSGTGAGTQPIRTR